MKAARYTGEPKTIQLGGGNWLEAGQLVIKPMSLVDSLLERPDFEEDDAVPPDRGHIDDPCKGCGLEQDDVPVGPCLGAPDEPLVVDAPVENDEPAELEELDEDQE